MWRTIASWVEFVFLNNMINVEGNTPVNVSFSPAMPYTHFKTLYGPSKPQKVAINYKTKARSWRESHCLRAPYTLEKHRCFVLITESGSWRVTVASVSQDPGLYNTWIYVMCIYSHRHKHKKKWWQKSLKDKSKSYKTQMLNKMSKS